MTLYKRLALFALLLSILSCGNGKDLAKKFKLTTNADKNAIVNGSDLSITLTPKNGATIDSVVYTLDNKRLGSVTDFKAFTKKVELKKLGKKTLVAKLYADGNTDEISEELSVLNTVAPKVYKYEIVNTYPHDVSSYTQGLEFKDGILYESAGQYGESSLMQTNFETGEIIKNIDLEDKFFAEGLTIINNKLFQLTWRENVGFVYNPETLEKTDSFTYNESKEGWGLCNDGNVIYKSDGTSKIWTLDPETLAETDYIEITDNKKVRREFNELEWVNGKIYANTYQYDSIAIIDPESGAIEAVIDLRSLKNKVQNDLDKDNEVLNGIAYKADEDRLFVTGKHWNKLFEIKIIKE